MSSEMKSGDGTLKLDLGEPSEYAKAKAIRELRETPENIENSLKALRELLKDEPTLSVPINNDTWLLKFLRVCKYYPESALDMIKRLFSLGLKYPYIVDKLVPSKLKHVYDSNLVSIAPNRDQCGRRIIRTMGGKIWDHHVITKYELLSATILCSYAVQLEPESLINGVIHILDLKDFTLSQCLEFTPPFVKLELDYIQDNLPIRMKGFHIVNQPSIFKPIFSLAKTFFVPKYCNRILMHGSNYKSLHEHISPEFLPECYGGTLKSDWSNGRETYEQLSHHEEYFETHQQYGVKKHNYLNFYDPYLRHDQKT